MIGYKDVVISPIEKEHVSFLVKCGNAKGIIKNRLTKRKTCLLEQTNCVENFDNSTFVIEKNKTQIGLCQFYPEDIHLNNYKLHVFFEDRAEEVPRSGAQSMNAILNYLFHVLMANKVSSDIIIDDVVMLNLYKKFLFKQEVRKRQHYFSSGYKTILEMGLLKEEFQVVQ